VLQEKLAVAFDHPAHELNKVTLFYTRGAGREAILGISIDLARLGTKEACELGMGQCSNFWL
jgi:hypothetical protein